MEIPKPINVPNPRLFVGIRPLPQLLLLLLVCFYTRNAAAAARIAAPPAPSPAASVISPKPSSPPSTIPTRKPAPSTPSSSSSALDPKQLSALQSMNLPTSKDPCTLPPPHNYTSCDSASPFRHVVSLSLSNCSTDLELPSTALRALSPTLRSVSFDRCPIPPPRLPAALISTLRSFSATASLKHLTGVYLSRLANLTDLYVVDVPVNASGPWIVLSRMRQLRRLAISGANLTGGVPRHWHVLNLTFVDLSRNRLRGTIPASIGRLTSLEYLDLSSNSLRGTLPDTLSNLVSLRNASFASNSLYGPLPDALADIPALAHLDLSGNKFNGTIPRFLANMRGLTHLNLENNAFRGVVPFNASFVGGLQELRLGGNSELCYNRTVLSSKLKLGIAPCDKYGMPIPPPPAPVRKHSAEMSRHSSDDDSDDGGGGRHGPSKVVLGVAIGLSCLVFLIVFMVCLSKCCG